MVVMVFLIYEMVPESYFLNTFENTLRSISGNFKVSFESKKEPFSDLKRNCENRQYEQLYFTTITFVY